MYQFGWFCRRHHLDSLLEQSRSPASTEEEPVRWSKHSRRCSGESARQSRNPTWSPPSPHQVLCCSGAWEFNQPPCFKVGPLNPLHQVSRDWRGSSCIMLRDNFTVLGEHTAQPWYTQPHQSHYCNSKLNVILTSHLKLQFCTLLP